MPKEWNMIEASYKKLEPAIKKIDPGKAIKQIKQVKDSLEVAWNAEDKFKEAFKTAKASGSKGKKPADYNGDQGFKTTYGVLAKAAALHLSAVEVLRTDAEQAKALQKELVKLLADIKKTDHQG